MASIFDRNNVNDNRSTTFLWLSTLSNGPKPQSEEAVSLDIRVKSNWANSQLNSAPKCLGAPIRGILKIN